MENEEYETIDLLEVLNAVRQHLAVLILCTLAAALALWLAWCCAWALFSCKSCWTTRSTPKRMLPNIWS